MELVNLSETVGRAEFFQQSVLLNLAYWQDWIKNNINDVPVLDRERNSLIRGILFALDLGEVAWSLAHELISTLAPYMERRGYWEIWRQVLDKALKVAGLVGDLAGMTHISALLGRLSFQQSHFQESVSYYRQTIRLARQIGDRFNEGRACTNLGYYYIERGQWWRAEVLCQYALQLFEEIDSNHGRAHTHNHLGFLYTWQGRWQEAQQHLEQACAIWQTMGDKHNLIWGNINLSGLYIKIEQPDLALRYLEKALNQANLVGEEAKKGLIYMNMGLAHSLAGNLIQAEIDSQQAETIFRRFASTKELARTWHILGTIYFRQSKWPEAVLYLENSLKTWRNLGHKPDEAQVLTDMVEYELAKGNHNQARDHLKEAEQIIRSNQELGWYRHLQSRLAQYRAKLNEKEKQ